MDARIDPTSYPTTGLVSPRPWIENDELKSILANLSQELCRPLSSLRAGFDLLLAECATPISDDRRGHVRTMVNLCDELLRLTHGYLDYASLLQDARPLRLSTFNMEALVREVDRQFGKAGADRRVAWVCALDGDDRAVTSDISLCLQILGHLVANALANTPEGGHIRVTFRVEATTRQWSATVDDDGPGIPADELGRVFEPFHRLAREANSRVDGNGLGLAVCREMVARLGGEIRLRSHHGEGTSVTVRLPIEAAADQTTTRR